MAFGPDVSIGQATPSGVASPIVDYFVPIVVGPHGLTGRVPLIRETDLIQPDYDEAGNEVYVQPPAAGISIPPACLSRLNSFGHGQCSGIQCPGVQPDGGCLCDVVKAANEQGIEWSFKVKVDDDGNQTWTYAGPPLQ